MTEKCFDIGTIQAFLDGELSSERLETVSRHVSVCDECAILLAEAEEESAAAFSALEQEFNTLVPTNRLWTKINDSIEGDKKTFWQSVAAYFTNPTVAALASVLIVIGLFAALSSLKTDNDKNVATKVNPGKQSATLPISNLQPSAVIGQPSEQNPAQSGNLKIAETSPFGNDKNKFKVVKVNFSEKASNRRAVKYQKPSIVERNPPPLDDVRTTNGNLSGEESYLKTIAALEKTVGSRKDEVLKPSARFAFERDLATTDDAIKKMKAEVGKNPKNEAARDVLRASYQNKIDLLNSVAEKSDLMASLK